MDITTKKGRRGRKDIDRIIVEKGRRGDFSPLQPDHYHSFYEIFYLWSGSCRFLLKDTVYQMEAGDLVFIAPGQVFGIDDGKILYGYKGWCLMFHPDLLRGTSLARRMADYSFFSYSSNEALHMSEREQQIIINCFREIREELQHAIDKHSKQIIAANIEVLLNHCVRFYDRQFVTRENVNKDLLTRFEELLRDYFTSDKPQSLGLPSVAWCADRLHLSANYFGDLIKKETGKSAQEYIQLTTIDRAKELLIEGRKSVSEIAYELGFKYPHHLSRLFKKVVGYTPNEYKTLSV